MDNNIESWIPLVGFEEKYQVSNLGRVKSLNYRGNTQRESILIPSVVGRYLKLSLVDNNNDVITRRVHRLVAISFLGPSNGMVVDHINGNGHDNRLCNLRYITSRGNITCENVKRKKPKASKFVGVSYNMNSNGKKKWRSIIVHNKVRYSLGTFETEQEARDAYMERLKKIENGRL